MPVRGLFTASRMFFVRDLGFFFWSRHLWLRHTIFGGELPLWDPYLASGHAAYADALNQMFMPVTLALRLLPSDVISFNLWVAMPLPVAMLGMFAFLRRQHRLASSALGACAYALSGTLVSSLNAPNLSWSLALLPWLCWAGDRLAETPGRRTAVVLAVVAALQALSGEPVTLAASIVVLIVHAIAARRGNARAAHVVAWLVAGLALGAALSAVQMVPTILAGIRAGRAAWSDTPDFWSLHPLAVFEAVVPHLFGDYYTRFLADMPWMTALNSGREPFFYSIYVGPLVILLACAGAIAYPRRTAPWVLLVLVFGIAAAGHYTPIYPAARRLFHPLAFFRFPIKYLAIAFFALAVLAAHGCDAVSVRDGASARVRRVAIAGAVFAVVMAAAVLFAVGGQSLALDAARALASRLHLENPDAGAAFLLRFGAPLAARSIGILLAGGALLTVASSDARRQRMAWAALLALCIGDLTVSNASLNPTIDVSKMQPPSWYSQTASADRLYIGGRVRGFMDVDDEDGSPGWDIPAEPTAIAGRAVLNAELPMEPSGYRVREAVSYDLPVLLPAEYGSALRRFIDAPSTNRAAFLRRAGVQWCVLPDDRSDGEVVAGVPDWHMHVTVCDPSAVRAFITPSAEIGVDPGRQQDALFDPRLADPVLRVGAAPPAAGTAGVPAAAVVTITRDRTNEVDLAASLPQAGFVVLRDSFDNGWRASVDGQDVEIVRANALYRAVHVVAGTHVIRFLYRPPVLAGGLTLTGIGIVFCCFLVVPRRRRAASAGLPRRSGEAAESGFTLLELMVVMALIGILLAIAFARYRGMRAKANETSADSALRTIATAQWTFALTCGHEKYATTLPALAQPVPSTGQAFLSPDLTGAEQVQHSGYLFQMSAKPLDGAPPSCSGVPVGQGYAVTADPLSPGLSGTRFLAINADRIVYADEKQTFTGNMPESGAPEHGVEVPSR